MIGIELLKTAAQSLIANKKRSFLTIIGIAIGIAAVITILGMGAGVKKTLYDTFGSSSQGEQTTEIDFYTDDSISTVVGFTPTDLANLRQKFPSQVTKIKVIHDQTGLSLKGQLGNRQQTITTSLLKKPTEKIKILAGRNIDQADLFSNQAVALLKDKVAKKQFGSMEAALGASLSLGSNSYRIVGVYHGQSTLDSYGSLNRYGVTALIPYQVYYQNQTEDSGNEIKLTFAKGANASKISKQLAKYLKKNGSAAHAGTYEYLDYEKALKQASATIGVITGFISLIAAISLFIAGIGVMNMMYISVSERTQEIGIRLAVGATPQNIMVQFLVEATILTVTGGMIGFVVGAGLSHLLAPLLSGMFSGGINVKAHISIGAFLLAFGVSAAVGLIFGILPAKQAANKNLIDILR